MNREHWKARLPFIEAFANGDDVQIKTMDGQWKSTETLTFALDPEDYRIAPKEKTGWINIYPDGCGGGKIYETREDADSLSAISRIACIQITYKEGDGL